MGGDRLTATATQLLSTITRAFTSVRVPAVGLHRRPPAALALFHQAGHTRPERRRFIPVGPQEARRQRHQTRVCLGQLAAMIEARGFHVNQCRGKYRKAKAVAAPSEDRPAPH